VKATVFQTVTLPPLKSEATSFSWYVVHIGSFRFTRNAPEVVRVRITSRMEFERDDGKQATAYKATLLNQPHHLEGFQKGDDVLFLADADYEHTVYATREVCASAPEF
jgi:hypothetical protein